MPVLIRLKPRSAGSGFLEVESLQAKDVVRTQLTESLVSQEWRIPEYTYMRNVPTLILGKKPAAAKERDEVVKTLSPKDRLAFQQIERGRCLDLGGWFEREPMRSIVRPYEAKLKEVERKMTEAKGQPETIAELEVQHRAVNDELMRREEVQKFLRGKMEKCLGEAGMSEEGRRAIADLLLRALRSSGQK